jgi:hypothetical protein
MKLVARLTTTIFFLGLITHLIPLVVSPALALTDEESTAVTAQVVNNANPTTPILISPDNNSTITTTLPTFVWEGSSDSNGIASYSLTLDGSVLFSSIPTSATDNANYTLTYDSGTNRYSLTVKSPISDGTHTWKITAFDTIGGSTDSATWTFTIDSLAPNFVVTAVGELTTSISAQDTSTIPSSPLELDNNSPLLVATGEANATVAVVLTVPGDPTQNFSTTIDGSGNWSLQLGLLPRNVVMTLDFTITDGAGNVSVLSGVQFLIKAEVITFPPTTPTPTPSASPDSTPPATPTASPSQEVPTTPAPSPIVTLTLVPPSEIIPEAIQEIFELLPEPVQLILQQLPEQIQVAVENTLNVVVPTSAVIATAAVPTLSLFALFGQLGEELSFRLLIKLLQAIGLLPKRKPQGMVYNSKTDEPVAFALLTVTSTDKTLEEPIQETVVTDVNGIYQGVKLPPGRYQLDVRHQEFTFPSKLPRPPYLSFQDHYLGEPFDVTSQSQEQLFLIPVDPITTAATKKTFRSRLRILLARFRLSNLAIPMFIFSFVIAIFFPTWLNWLIVGFYSIVLVRKAVLSQRIPRISGVVLGPNQQPLVNAIVRLNYSTTNQLAVLVTTNHRGEFATFVEPELYQISVNKTGYFWQPEASGTLSIQQVDARKQHQVLLIEMIPSASVSDELFANVASL